MAAFDWYQATVPVPVDDLLEALSSLSESPRIAHARGLHGYAYGTVLEGSDGPVATVYHGGIHHHPHAKLTGESAHAGAECIRVRFPEHSVTRVDAREDFSDEGAFERILPGMVAAAQRHRLTPGCAGDWAVHHEARTFYLGSVASPCRQRLYDKAAELRGKFAADPVRLATIPQHLARLEAQVRPKTKEAKREFATMEPMAVMGASTWLCDVWRHVSGLELTPVQVGVKWRQSDDDRARSWMYAQYGGLLKRLFADAGSWECLGLQIGHDLGERDAAQRKAKREGRTSREPS